jgi:RNA polymerase sigma factor (sigma-70 family)
VTDREIAEAIRRGREARRARPDDPGPVDELSEAHGHLHRMLKTRFLGFLSFGTSKETGEDLLQELCIGMVIAIDEQRIEDLDALGAYARGMARNLRSRAIEKQSERMRKVIPIGPYLASGVDHEKDQIEREQAAELAGIFQGLLADLDPQDRSLVERFYFRGQDAAQIQSDLGIGPGQFRGKMERLRKQLKADYERIKRLSPPDEPLSAA